VWLYVLRRRYRPVTNKLSNDHILEFAAKDSLDIRADLSCSNMCFFVTFLLDIERVNCFPIFYQCFNDCVLLTV